MFESFIYVCDVLLAVSLLSIVSKICFTFDIRKSEASFSSENELF